MRRFFGLVLMLLSFTCAVGGGYYLARSEKLAGGDVAYVYLYGIATGATGALGSMILPGNSKKKD